MDGDCVEQCDCGDTNPCAEYIFDNRGGEVDGRNFTEWFINEYMVTNETLSHKYVPCRAPPPPLSFFPSWDANHSDSGLSLRFTANCYSVAFCHGV